MPAIDGLAEVDEAAMDARIQALHGLQRIVELAGPRILVTVSLGMREKERREKKVNGMSKTNDKV